MRRLGILTAVFGVLVLALLIQRHQQGKTIAKGPAAVVQIEEDRVSKVAIHRPGGEEVELVRTGEAWKLTKPVEYAANGDLVRGMLRSVEELKLVDIISSNPANQGTYQVDSTGTAVQIWTGDKVALDLVVGKATADWSHTFVRRAEEKDVYRADGALSYNFNRQADEWRDKTILNIAPADVQHIDLEYPAERQTVAVARTDSTHWSVAGGSGKPAPADSATTARLVAAAAQLKTVSFAKPEETAQADWSKPAFRLTVRDAQAAHAVEFVALDDNRFLARKADDPAVVFSLYRSNLATIMKKAKELEPGYTPLPDAPAAKKKTS